MKLISLLDDIKNTQDIAVSDDWELGITYSKKLNCYVWCDKSGRVIEDISDYTGYKRVILSSELLKGKSWCLDIKEKSYVEKRTEEIMGKYNISKMMEEYYNLGFATAWGHVLYMISNDFDNKGIKKIIMNETKEKTQMRCDMYGAWDDISEVVKDNNIKNAVGNGAKT